MKFESETDFVYTKKRLFSFSIGALPEEKMKKLKCTVVQEPIVTQPQAATSSPGFDLFRLSKSKDVVDVCPNTLRAYFAEGLPFYKKGKAIFVSKTELANFIRS